jgi:hypothetical protein
VAVTLPCRFHLTTPSGMCGTVKCDSGCAPIEAVHLKLGPPNQATIIMLNAASTADNAAENCTDVRRAYNAVMAGASGVLLKGSPEDKTWAELVPNIDPKRDDLASVRAINVPVGKITAEQGGQLFQHVTFCAIHHHVCSDQAAHQFAHFFCAFLWPPNCVSSYALGINTGARVQVITSTKTSLHATRKKAFTRSRSASTSTTS